MPSAFERFADKTTSGRALLKDLHSLAWIVFLVAPVRSISSSIALFTLWLLHVTSTSASCTWRALNGQHRAVDPLAAQFHWAQRHAQTDAAQSIGKCERTLWSASKASNLHITCEVHVEVGRQRELFQLQRAAAVW